MSWEAYYTCDKCDGELGCIEPYWGVESSLSRVGGICANCGEDIKADDVTRRKRQVFTTTARAGNWFTRLWSP